MIKLTSEADKVCVAKANEAGQGHVFDGWDELSPEGQRTLIAQLQQVDFQLVKRLVHDQAHLRSEQQPGRVLKPVPLESLPSPETDRESFELSRTLGEYALRNREVLLVTAAGGGSIAPLSEPVGMLPVGPVTRKSVFQLHAEKIQAINRRYRTTLRWTIVCHPDEREKVAAYFKANAYFGLQCTDLCITEQDLLPVFDKRGKILLSAPGRMAMCPSGHGGVMLRILEEGRLEAMESAGIRHIFYFQVDNPLVHIADPVFLGYHIKNQCEASSKAVVKSDPHERVGVFCRVNGGPKGSIQVIEHTELSREDREERLANGSLALSAANSGTHVFSMEFLRRMREEGIQLPFHAVPRATPYLGRRGKVVQPGEPNSVRFVTFAFDALRFAGRQSLIEVRREEEFSPIKHATGSEASLETAQRDLSRVYGRWLRDAVSKHDAVSKRETGVPAEPASGPRGDDPPEPVVEISPLYAMDAAELKEKLAERTEPLPARQGEPILLGSR
jgi:UDP-N-acetylglucosamine/UDP-N-acetylgalactosamine diphosphorylase